MHFNTVLFLLIIHYFLIFVSCHSTFDKNKFSCSIIPKELPTFECVIDFLFWDSNTVPECIKAENTITVSVGMLKNKLPILNLSFVCTSDSPLALENIRFKDRRPKVEYTNIRSERSFANYWDIDRYKYKLHVKFPNDPDFSLLEGELVEYIIYSPENPNAQLHIFFEIFAKEIIGPFKICRRYNLQGKAPIDVSQEVTTIPFVNFENNTKEPYYVPNLTYNDKTLPIDNESLFYNPLVGFLLNTKYFTFERYDIMTYKYCPGDSSHLVTLKGIGYYQSPETKEISLYQSKFNGLLQGTRKKEDGITLTCSRVGAEENIELLRFPGDDPNVTINIIYSNYSVGESPKRYFATAKVPYLTEEERLNTTGWLDYESNKLQFQCVNSPGIRWLVQYDAQYPLYYSPEHGAFICEGVNTEPLGESFYSTTIRHWACNNIYQCQIVSSYCLIDDEYYGHDGNLAYCLRSCDINLREMQMVYKCLKILQTNPIPCSSVGLRYRGYQMVQCEAVLPAKKGIVQCFTKNVFDVRLTYFEGFDGRIYVEKDDKEPPVDATLKISCLNSTDYFYTKAKFHLRCEAQSFFYEDGIQWFWRYENGTVMKPPSECVENLEMEPRDSYNPEVNALFNFQDKNVIEIICSAPLLNSNKWQNVSMNIRVEEATPPVITSNEPVIFLVDNSDDQSMTCQSSGIPQPNIVWERFSEEISEPLRILEGKILIFPGYNETFLGLYTCRAVNVAGNASKDFIVDKFEVKQDESYGDNNIVYAYYGIGALIAIIIIVSSVAIRYYRIQNRKKYQEMREIIHMLEGVQPKDNQQDKDSHSDPTSLPFNKKYELEKQCFEIDWETLLGKGEFGEVYQGKINGLDGPAAFKTLKSDASLQHLKALASEIKILMYVGPHDNLVTLLGAYKKDLEKGILYAAVEFCGLGSLESYLKTYKHLFLKCPFLYNNIGTHKRKNGDGSDISQNVSIHSLQNLLKWCKQIASGMEYLASKYVVHADLASRNVLLTAELNAKVTDFGLSRRMYNYTEYIKTGKEPLPWKWLAPECFREKIFTTKSDVWSYGITLWEIFSLGDSPYPGIQLTAEFIEQLEKGTLRNKEPKYAPKQMYDLMCKCWESDPGARPLFSLLQSSFEIENFNTILPLEKEIHDAEQNEHSSWANSNTKPVSSTPEYWKFEGTYVVHK